MQTNTCTSTSSTIQRLLKQGDFLHLSRRDPERFSTPIDFVLPAQTKVRVFAEGIICFEPVSATDKDIVLSCGVHGNETAPIEICDDLVCAVLTGQIEVKQRLLVIFGNLPAMDIEQRFVVENMNRLFSGEHQKLALGQQMNAERRRAAQLEDVVREFYLNAIAEEARVRYHYDLHTAIRPSKNHKFAVYPFQEHKPWDKYQLQILLACGVNTILLSGNPTSTFSYYSANQFDAHAFTVELGKVQPFGQNHMADFASVVSVLRKLICGHELNLKPYDEADFLIYKVNQVINKQQADFALSFADDTPNFTDFPKGAVLAQESGAMYQAQLDGEAIVFPNAQVEIGQRAMLTVVPTSID